MITIKQDIFTALMEHIDEEILIADESGRILFINSKVAEVWGGIVGDYIDKDCRTLSNKELRATRGASSSMLPWNLPAKLRKCTRT